MFRVVGFLALVALPACAQVQLEHQSDSFNRASANVIAEHTLLNAVRSSLDRPMSFTKLLKFTAGSMAHGTVVPKLPFGGDAMRIFDLGPTLNWSGGVSQIEYGDANNSGALAKLNENLQYDTLDRYAYQGLHGALLMTVLVEHVEIHGKLLAKIYKHQRHKCPDPIDGNKAERSSEPICDELLWMAKSCGWPKHTFGEHSDIVTIDNRADTRCNFLKFQAFRYHLALAEYSTDAVAVTSLSKLKTPEGTLLDVPKKSIVQQVDFGVKDIHDEFIELDKELEKDFKRKKRDRKNVRQKSALKVAYRSPKSLLAYLGELIALQNFSADRYVPEIVIGKKREAMTVFRVIRGPVTDVKAALSIRGPDGEVYVVPQPDYGSPTRDQTLRVLAIAGEIVNGALSDKDFPAPATVVVRAFE